MVATIGVNLKTHTGFLVLVDGEVAGTLAFNTILQPGIIAAFNSNFAIQPHSVDQFPKIGSIWNGTEFVDQE